MQRWNKTPGPLKTAQRRLDCLQSGLTLAARSGGHPGDQQEGTSHCSQHHERAEMMVVRLAAQRSSFSHSRRLRRVAGVSQTRRFSSRLDGCSFAQIGEFRYASYDQVSS
jgi:hypothetical protein